ncbi:MAG: carbon dioxide-concentrating mechanism protein CcmK [Leptolyngbyaceae cyanobacterium bins.59]|nr:carbon dioxide-concentrating mechanism protein CcmK [Leptolyngbyaceae cyanobacterium bins.59]
MGVAVGMVEVLGHPPALAVADVMVKAARVTLVGYERVSGARLTIIVRGDVSEVQRSVEAGIEAAHKVAPQSPKEKTLFLSSHVIARPNENLDAVLPIHFRAAIEQFRV